MTIPVSEIVSVTPNVLAAGGAAVNLNGLFLTSNPQVPIGTFQQFGTALAVSNYFGAASVEAARAAVYFNGFDQSNVKPAALLMAQYNTVNVAGYVRGGNAAAVLTLAQLQALNAALSVTIDGVVKSGTVNLSAATSFSSAAQIIADALDIESATVSNFTASFATSVMTVTVFGSGAPIAVGQFVHSAGVAPGTFITSLGTGVGGTGTYNLSTTPGTISAQAATANSPGVSFDSVSGGFVITSPTTGAASTVTFPTGALATSLLLTAATGAVQSPGAIAAVPSIFMNALAQLTQNWATFTTLFDPDNGSGSVQKLLFAAWVSGTNRRYAYIAWDTDVVPTVSNPANSSFGRLLITNNYEGVCPIWQPSDLGHAAFICGAIASIDFTQPNGRADMAFRKQAGLVPGVTSQVAGDNLQANGYNIFAAYGTANANFQFLYPGSISGAFLWLDSYVNQIWLNTTFQLALMNLLTTAFSVPYNAAGRAQISAGLQDTIQQGLSFGVFRAGVSLSSSQIAAVNAAAGVKIDTTLATQGWYLQVGVASPLTRQNRDSPPINFWYMDGESVQQINLTSTDLL